MSSVSLFNSLHAQWMNQSIRSSIYNLPGQNYGSATPISRQLEDRWRHSAHCSGPCWKHSPNLCNYGTRPPPQRILSRPLPDSDISFSAIDELHNETSDNVIDIGRRCKKNRHPNRPHGRLPKKAHLRRCARPTRSNVLLCTPPLAGFLARLASGTFLSNLSKGI